MTAFHAVRTSTGGDAGAPVVLIHGVGDSAEAWDDVVALLPPGLDAIRYDLRGHGRSPKPPGPYALDDFVADHLALLGRLGVARAHVVGYSLGGLIAQAIAIAAPDTVDRLVLLSCIAGRTPAEAAAARDRLAALERSGTAGMADASAERWYSEGFRRAHPEKVRAALDRFRANDPDAYLAAYRVLATSDLAARLGEIAVPTLVLTGEHDVGSPPRMARLMAERIPDAALRILDGQKHAVLAEAPEVVADAIGRFLG